MALLRDLSPLVEALSLDEAFVDLAAGDLILLVAALDRHDAATVHLGQAGVGVDHQGGVLVDANHRRLGREHGAQGGVALLAHKAAAGIEVGATLGVVPVGDKGQAEAVWAKEVETRSAATAA